MSDGVSGVSGSGYAVVLGCYRDVIGRQWRLSNIWACFPPFPITISLSLVRPLTFFGVAGCPERFTYQNVRMLRSF